MGAFEEGMSPTFEPRTPPNASYSSFTRRITPVDGKRP
jgi:hypothetical protein